MRVSRQAKEIFLLLILYIVSRLPQLLSDNLLLDGDECIEALMAKHLFEGTGTPFYFYGQSYGFAFIEMIFIDLMFLLAGISGLSVKLAMLLLWSIGILFFYKTLRQLHAPSSWLPFLISVLMIFLPAWAVWSMKARGGYLTAFTLSFILSYLLLSPNYRYKPFLPLICGIIVVTIYESQPLWLPGLLPLIFYRFRSGSFARTITSFVVGCFFAAIIFYFLKRNITSFWMPSVFYLNVDILGFLVKLPYYIYSNLTGSYYYFDLIPLNNLVNGMAVLFTGLTLFIPVIAAFLLFRKQKNLNPHLIVFSCSVLFTLGYLLFLNGFSPRYLLPLSGFLLLALSQLLKTLSSEKLPCTFLSVCILGGIPAMFTFKDYKFEVHTEKQLMTLIKKIEEKEISHVFCTHGFLQWQLMFYSKENIIARFTSPNDRYPPYITAVDQAFASHKKTAVCGYFDYADIQRPANYSVIENIYFIHEEPSKEIVTDLYKFQFAALDAAGKNE